MGREFKCPFCEQPLASPAGMKAGLEDVEGGRCGCGAVYVYDRTGRKLGEAYSEALLLAYGGDYDRAFSAGEGEYEELILRHHRRLNKFIEGEGGRMDRSPKLYFIRRKKPEA